MGPSIPLLQNFQRNLVLALIPGLEVPRSDPMEWPRHVSDRGIYGMDPCGESWKAPTVILPLLHGPEPNSLHLEKLHEALRMVVGRRSLPRCARGVAPTSLLIANVGPYCGFWWSPLERIPIPRVVHNSFAPGAHVISHRERGNARPSLASCCLARRTLSFSSGTWAMNIGDGEAP